MTRPQASNTRSERCDELPSREDTLDRDKKQQLPWHMRDVSATYNTLLPPSSDADIDFDDHRMNTSGDAHLVGGNQIMQGSMDCSLSRPTKEVQELCDSNTLNCASR